MTYPARNVVLGSALVVGAVIAGGALFKFPAPATPPGVPPSALLSSTLSGGANGLFGPSSSGQTTVLMITPALLEVNWTSADTTAVHGGGTNPPVIPFLKPENFSVRSQGNNVPIKTVGFRQRAAYAPFKQKDLRIGSSLFLELQTPVPEDEPLEISGSGYVPWPGQGTLSFRPQAQRWSPAIHVSQSGYLPALPKRAMVGYYLGTLGEADLTGLTGNSSNQFSILDGSGKAVFSGTLKPRADEGFTYPAYRQVLEADFSGLQTTGTYRVFVPGLGVSFPFIIDDAAAGAWARTYALGLYHQRCGTSNALPFTRFTHRECHVAPAAVPDNSPAFDFVNWVLNEEASGAKDQPRHTAPAMTNLSLSLYPFVNRGPVDVRGGHHDAGDYSKYTINSASFVHHLVIACDALPGVAALDNLGLPESGDGKGDVLQEAKWEADFLAKMQDADGGFYFLVYPRNRRYEDDVTPDKGDPQVVFPKTTAATAAAVAALAECASSPEFKRQFPEAVAGYMDKARRGWAFLSKAIATYGKDGSYQKITHYGNDFMHDDELAWAAVEMYLATGEAEFRQRVAEWFKPDDPDMRRWGWWRLFDAQGCATRSYALAVKTGRMKPDQLDSALLAAAQQEVRLAGQDQARRSVQSAYGTSFPEETKRVRSAGWYFSMDAAFDLAIAQALEPAPSDPLREAIAENIAYEQGRNPVNVDYLTGLGAVRQFEIVHQYAQNDRRMLPPSGIPLGNIQEGISWIDLYKNEPAMFSIPSDEDLQEPYPFYDRWADAFNLSQEFVILNQARGLAVTAWLMAQGPLKDQPWKPVAGVIAGAPPKPKAGQSYRLQLTARGLDLSPALTLWEASGLGGACRGPWFDWTPSTAGSDWVEAEAELPDGRRVFGVLETSVR